MKFTKRININYLKKFDNKSFSYSQARLLNILVANYFIQGLDNEIFDISLSSVKEYLGLKNDKQIIDLAQKLSKDYLSWDREGNFSGFSSLISNEILIDNGRFFYNFPVAIKGLLASEKINYILEINIINLFKNKFTPFLYKIVKKEANPGKTEWLDVEIFRKMLEVPETKVYDKFKSVISKIINPGIAEINMVSDLNISVEYIMGDQKTKAVRFKIEKSRPEVISPIIVFDDIEENNSAKEDDQENSSFVENGSFDEAAEIAHIKHEYSIETKTEDGVISLTRAREGEKNHIREFLESLTENELSMYQDEFKNLIKDKRMVYNRFLRLGFSDILIQNVFEQFISEKICKFV